MGRPMIDHRRALMLAATAVDFPLDPSDRGILDAHVRACAACRMEVAAFSHDAARLAALAPTAPPEWVRGAIGRSRRPNRLVLLAAAALLLSAAAGVALVGAELRTDRAPDVLPSRSPATSPAASPATSPAASTQSLAPGWERQAIQTGLGVPLLTRVVWTGTRFLAVDLVDGTLLDSTDGHAWHQQPRVAGGYVNQVAAGPAGVLATGSRNTDTGGVVAIWQSPDGLSWSATPDAPSLHGTNGAFLSMAAIPGAGDGWLAVGGESLSCAPGPCLVRAVTWMSPDGLQWTRGPDTGAMQHAGMTGVVRTPTGFVAVGDADADPSGVGSAVRPAVWTSPDGRAWTQSGGLPVVKAPKGANVILDSVAAIGSRVVAVGHVSSQAGGAEDAFAWWSDGGTWSSADIGPFTLSQGVRVVAVPGGLLAMFGFGSDARCSSAIWSSVDGSAWTCIGNDPAFAGAAVADAAAAPGVEVLVGSGPNSAFVWTSAPAPVRAATSPAPNGSSEPSQATVSAAPTWTAGSLPAALGDGQMAPGPAGGLYVLIDAPQVLLAGPPSRAVLALLDAGGQPRPGWPIQLIGWNCADPNGAERAWSAAADGSTRLVCTNDIAWELATRHVAFAFDAAGRVMPGWPVELPAGDLTSPPQVVGTELRVLQHEFAPSNGDGSPQAGAWWVTAMAADGTIRQGVRYDVPDMVPYQDARLGSDGAAYLLSTTGTPGAEITSIVALDIGGVRDGWPLKEQGILSHPAIGPQGRVYVVQTQGTGASIRSQTLVFEPNGLDVPIGSAALPLPARTEWTGEGADFFLAAPMVASDGTVFLPGERGGRSVVYAIDPSGSPMQGWPTSLEAGLQIQGTCPALGNATGCGKWSASPTVGPDGTLYLLLAAVSGKAGGSIVAIAPDGHVRPGWPVRLPAAGAGFWSAVVGLDGTVYAMAVEPSAGSSSRTLYAIDPDGTVRARTPIISAGSPSPSTSP
jgi:hypothetical protein